MLDSAGPAQQILERAADAYAALARPRAAVPPEVVGERRERRRTRGHRPNQRPLRDRSARIWSAVAERSGDTALGRRESQHWNLRLRSETDQQLWAAPPAPPLRNGFDSFALLRHSGFH